MQEELVFQTRSFIFSPSNKKITILLQKDNGPCMLIAIFNCLALKNKIKIQPGKYSASLIIDLIIGTCPQLIDFGENLLSLVNGCSVNPVFSSCNEFKEYPEFLRLLNLQMYHGMLPDPASSSFDIVSGYDYESLEMKILDLESTTYLLNNNSENSPNNTNSTEQPASKENNLQLNSEDKKLLAYLKDFHRRIQRQITDIGIEAIDGAMQNGDAVIFFRSSHFSVLIKHMNRVFSLITDESFNGSNCVWETLPNENGDSKYFDQDFILSSLTMKKTSTKNQRIPNNANQMNNYTYPHSQVNKNPYNENYNQTNNYTNYNNNNNPSNNVINNISSNSRPPPVYQNQRPQVIKPNVQQKSAKKGNNHEKKKKSHHKNENCLIF